MPVPQYRYKTAHTTLSFTVPSTQSWDTFRFIQIPGSIGLKKGLQRIAIVPQQIRKKHLMMFRRVILVPVHKRHLANVIIRKIRLGYHRRMGAYTQFKRGLTLYRKKRFGKAILFFKRAIQLDRAFSSCLVLYRSHLTQTR